MEKNLNKLFEQYISECEYSVGLRPATIQSYKESFELFNKVVPEVDNINVLTVEMMNIFFKRLRTRPRIVGKNIVKIGLKDSTIKTYANKLNAFFEWMIRRNILLKNPLRTIKIPYPQYTDERALSDEEVRKILAVPNRFPSNSLILRRDTVMLSILLYSGVRKGEFISLRIVDIDMVKKILTVRGETSKSKKTRYIPMHPTLVFHMKEYLEERNRQGYKTENLIVSSSEDKGLSRDGLKHWVKRYNKLSWVKFHLHRFRHTFTCTLYKGGTGIINIQKLLGHADMKMTALYLRSIKCEDSRGDIDKMSFG